MNRLISIIKHSLLAFIMVLNYETGSFAQSAGNNTEGSDWRIGLEYSYGSTSFFGQKQYSYDYSVRIFKLTADYMLFNKSRWSGRLILNPQFNVTDYFSASQNARLDGTEYGINLGLAIFYNLKGVLPYLLLSLGPHHISGSPDRQAAGFIFSDNMEFGVEINLWKNYYFDMGIGFRHISNASLKQPNGGINSFLYSVGLKQNI